MKPQYDNSNSGALFPVKDQPDLMQGPFQLGAGKEAKHIVVANLGKPGTPHVVRLHERKKDNSAGKIVAEGTLIGSKSGGAVNAAGNPTPAGRITLSTKKGEELHLCVWKQANTKQGGSYYQLKPDSFEPVEAPAL